MSTDFTLFFRIDSNKTLSMILESCRGDGMMGVYTLFELKSKFDVDQWVNDFSLAQVSDEIRKLVEVDYLNIYWVNIEKLKLQYIF